MLVGPLRCSFVWWLVACFTLVLFLPLQSQCSSTTQSLLYNRSTDSIDPISNRSIIPWCNSKLPFLFVDFSPEFLELTLASSITSPPLLSSIQLELAFSLTLFLLPACVLLPFWLTAYFPNATWKPIVSTLPCNNPWQLKENNLWLLPKEGSIIFSLTLLK